MADHLVLDSPFGPLAFSAEEIREAAARATEMVQAVGLQADPDSTPTEPETWLTVTQAAEHLNAPRCYVYEGLKAGEIPGRRLGRFWRVPLSWINANQTLD